MKKIKVKKKRKILYLGHKENKILSEQGLLNKNYYNTRRKLSGKEKKLKKIPKLKSTQIIAVACLDNECGCTYITKALSNYIRAKVNSSICFVDIALNNNDNNQQLRNLKMNELYNPQQSYNYVVVDMGNLKDRSDTAISEFKKANIKIMVSNLEDNYLRRLAAYIKEDKKTSKKHVYIFNLVPKEQQKRVFKLMEAYEHYCLPVINKDNLSYEAQKIFNTILRRKRG